MIGSHTSSRFKAVKSDTMTKTDRTFNETDTDRNRQAGRNDAATHHVRPNRTDRMQPTATQPNRRN
eukprot:6946965-Pyramimonas_sp.AAC.1